MEFPFYENKLKLVDLLLINNLKYVSMLKFFVAFNTITYYTEKDSILEH